MSSTENFTGTNASGSDGATNRVITLSNSVLTTANGFEVFTDGLFLHLTTDYTVSHNATSTQITFLNALFNSQNITVIYEVTPSPSAGSSGILPVDSQLINNEITYIGDSVTVRVVTDTSYSDYGDATESTSDTTDVKCVMNDLSPEETKDKEGIMLGADKRFFFQNSQTGISNGNRIIFDSKTYEIVKVTKHTLSGVTTLIEAYGKLV